MINNNLYYRDTYFKKYAATLSLSARKKIYNFFISQFPSNPNIKILDLGVTSDVDVTANYLEQFYPYLNNITCAGVQDCSKLSIQFPGVTTVKLDYGKSLPFLDNEFDIVYSNAVIEHVGSITNQLFFLSEALRVSRSFFICTPNRWFPVEHHTHIPLLHYLPKSTFRRFLSFTGDSFFSLEDNLNLCSQNDLLNLFPTDINPQIKKIWTLGFVSNLIAYGHKN
jgi:hypothetical protein